MHSRQTGYGEDRKKERVKREEERIKEEYERLVALDDKHLMVELIFAVRGFYYETETLKEKCDELSEQIDSLEEEIDCLRREMESTGNEDD